MNEPQILFTVGYIAGTVERVAEAVKERRPAPLDDLIKGCADLEKACGDN